MSLKKNTTSIQIKRYENEDLSLVKEFYERSYPGDLGRKIEAFRWITGNNPFRAPKNSCVLILNHGKVVGYCGIMPMKFYLNGQPFMAIFGQEILVDPSFRGQGLGSKLIRELKSSKYFWISLWFNENLLPILQKEGKLNIGYFRPLKKIFRMDNLLKLKAQEWMNHRIIENLLTRLAKRYNRYKLNHEKKYEGDPYHIEPIVRFGSEHDDFFFRVVKHFRLISDRTSQTLNWKYIDIPHRRFYAFGVRKDKAMVGYIVIGVEQREQSIKRGLIADILIDPKESEAIGSLLKVSEDLFMREEVDFSVCQLSFPMFQKGMKARGYHNGKRAKCDCLLIANEKYTPDPEIVRDIHNWYFTYGDSDYCLW